MIKTIIFDLDGVDAGLATFTATHPKWSFAKLGKDGFVCEVAEKKPISNIANTGFHWFKKGSDYIRYAEQMIKNNVQVNGEFYVAPVLNEFIEDGKKVKHFPIAKMHGLGDPESLQEFLRKDIKG